MGYVTNPYQERLHSCSMDSERRAKMIVTSPDNAVQQAKQTHTHTQPFYGSMDYVWDNPGEPVPEETFTNSRTSRSSIISICFLHLLRSMASSLFNPHALQYFSTMSLQVFLAWRPPLHTPHISSPNHYLLFAAHVHTKRRKTIY